MTENPVIRDRSLPAVQRIADLAKHSVSPGKLALIEDEDPLINSLRAGLRFMGLYAVAGSSVSDQLMELSAAAETPIDLLDNDLAKALFRSDKRPDVFGIAKAPKPVGVQDFLGSDRDILILDGVRIVGNIGAIARSAYAFGMAGIVLVNSGLTSITDRRLIRASRGYVFSLPTALMEWPDVSALLAKNELTAVAVDAAGSERLEDLIGYRQALAFVVGAETTGLSRAGRELCEISAAIPMNRHVESLNVSVAAGVLMQLRAERNLRRVPYADGGTAPGAG